MSVETGERFPGDRVDILVEDEDCVLSDFLLGFREVAELLVISTKGFPDIHDDLRIRVKELAKCYHRSMGVGETYRIGIYLIIGVPFTMELQDIKNKP